MSTPVQFQVTVPSAHDALSSLRHDLRRWYDALECAPLPPIVDVDVVVTELVANVIDHADASTVDLVVAVDAPRVRVEVTNEAGAEAPVFHSEWAVTGERGRGLRLVAALSADLQLRGDDRHSVVVADLVADGQSAGES